MKFTLGEIISRINQALNNPSLTYSDIYHFFDQAMYELNSSLKIALPSVTEILDENSFKFDQQPNLVNVDNMDSDGDTFVTDKDYNGFKYSPMLGDVRSFVIVKDGVEQRYYDLYGYKVTSSKVTYYGTRVIGGIAYWVELDYNTLTTTLTTLDITEYLPFDWWVLFVIPYVCSKWAVRNGDDSAHFVDEYIQGFQQLQNSYNVPNRVRLSTVADKLAYKKLVEERLPNLNAIVFTRAIYDNMKVGNGIAPVYGGFYETGGWGV